MWRADGNGFVEPVEYRPNQDVAGVYAFPESAAAANGVYMSAITTLSRVQYFDAAHWHKHNTKVPVAAYAEYKVVMLDGKMLDKPFSRDAAMEQGFANMRNEVGYNPYFVTALHAYGKIIGLSVASNQKFADRKMMAAMRDVFDNELTYSQIVADTDGLEIENCTIYSDRLPEFLYATLEDGVLSVGTDESFGEKFAPVDNGDVIKDRFLETQNLKSPGMR